MQVNLKVQLKNILPFMNLGEKQSLKNGCTMHTPHLYSCLKQPAGLLKSQVELASLIYCHTKKQFASVTDSHHWLGQEVGAQRWWQKSKEQETI